MKAKRKLTNIDFSDESAHLAVTSKTLNGGPANKADYALVIKSREFSEEFIEKLQQVKITMELPDFLQKFFYLMEEEAKALAYMMGYREVTETQEYEDAESEEDFRDWIESRMESLELIKEMRNSESPELVLASADEESLMALMKDQEMLEKAFKKLDDKKAEEELKAKKERKKPKLKTTRSYTDSAAVVSKAETLGKESTDVALATEGDKPQIASEVKKEEATASVVKTKQKEKLMTTDVKVVEQVVETEVIEKAKFDEVQKAFNEMQVELQKAKEMLAVFEAEKKALIEKARKEKLQAAVKDEGRTEVFFKFLKDVDDEQFEAVVKALGEMTAIVEKSELFEEQGATVTVEEPVVKESLVAKALKAKLQAAK